VRRLLDDSAVGPFRFSSVRWVHDIEQQLRSDGSMDPAFRSDVIEEIGRIGDRDLVALAHDSAEVVTRRDATADEYQRALRNARRAVQLAPWSAYCIGVLGMAQYRIGDDPGALDRLGQAASLRGEALAAESVFRTMALNRLGRATEAAAVAEGLRAETATSSDTELKTLLRELEEMLRRR
jgi:hypothetical protein